MGLLFLFSTLYYSLSLSASTVRIYSKVLMWMCYCVYKCVRCGLKLKVYNTVIRRLGAPTAHQQKQHCIYLHSLQKWPQGA